MTQYNTLNVKLSNSQFNKQKYGTKNGTEVTLELLSNVAGDSNDKNNFRHKLLLTNIQVSKLPKGFANGSSADIKLLKTQLHKLKKSGGFLGRLLKSGLPLIKNLLKPLAKSILLPLELTAAVSATDAAIQKKMFGSGSTPSTIFNEEINNIMKIIRSLEESGLLVNGVSYTIKNEAKKQKGGFLVCY